MKTTIEADRVRVVEECEPGADGKPTERSWDCTPEQAAKHLPRWTDPKATARISAGDESAIRDAAHEAAKKGRA